MTQTVEVVTNKRIAGTITKYLAEVSSTLEQLPLDNIAQVVGLLEETQRRIKAIALTDNVALMSAWANDNAYENIFAEQLQNLTEAADVVIAISCSGNSENVINGVKVARAKGASTVGLIGFNGGKLKDLVDIQVLVPNDNMEQVEDIHLLIGHVIKTCLLR